MPKKFTIKGETWTVVEKEVVVVDGKPVDGCADTITRIIEICSTLPEERRLLTYLHELHHAFLHELHVADVLSEEIEEIICDGFAKCILDINKSAVYE